MSAVSADAREGNRARKFSESRHVVQSAFEIRPHRNAIDRSGFQQASTISSKTAGSKHVPEPKATIPGPAKGIARTSSLYVEADTGHSREKELTDADLLCQQAGKLLANGETEDAYDMYCDVLAMDSRNIKALSTLAVLNHKRGMFDVARTLYQRCLRCDPTRCKSAYNLGRLEHECKNHEAARELYRVTLELNPDNETACSSLAYEGLLLQEVFGDYDGASKCYDSSLARNPMHVRTLDHKCALLRLCGKIEEAQKLHDTVRDLDPGHSARWCPYVSCLFSGDLILKAQGPPCNHHPKSQMQRLSR